MILYLPSLSLLPFPLQFTLFPPLTLPLIPSLLSPALLYLWDWISEHQHTWSDAASRSTLQTAEKKKSSVDVSLSFSCWVDLHYAVFSRAELYLHTLTTIKKIQSNKKCFTEESLKVLKLLKIPKYLKYLRISKNLFTCGKCFHCKMLFCNYSLSLKH